jgi:ApaG protein
MKTATTEGVQISVSIRFRSDLSDLFHNKYFFNYRIEIQNNNSFDIQLMHRDWFIFDSLEEVSFVSGDGVVGEQPILRPNQKYAYVSGCELSSEIGQMKGFYTFKRLENDSLFQVHIPQFDLIYPGKLN